MVKRYLPFLALILIVLVPDVQAQVTQADERSWGAHVYGMLGITVPLLPQSFSRAHEIGLGGAAGGMWRTNSPVAIFAEGEYNYTPVSFLGLLVDYGSLHQTGARGGIRYFLTGDGAAEPFLMAGGGMSYANFGPADDPNGEAQPPDDDQQFPDRSNHWHPHITGGGGTLLSIGDGLSVKSEIQLHLAFMSHGAMFSLTPRLGMTYSW